MAFEWRKGKLIHTDAQGVENVVEFHDVQDYVSKLHMSERQQPLPPFPLETVALDVAAEPAVQEAADQHPDSLRAAIAAALLKAEAALLAADCAVEKASDSAVQAFAALRDLKDYAAQLAAVPAPVAPTASPAVPAAPVAPAVPDVSPAVVADTRIDEAVAALYKAEATLLAAAKEVRELRDYAAQLDANKPTPTPAPIVEPVPQTPVAPLADSPKSE